MQALVQEALWTRVDLDELRMADEAAKEDSVRAAEQRAADQLARLRSRR